MNPELPKRSLIPTGSVAQLLAMACSLAAAAILLLGFRKLGELELNEAQLYSATLQTLMLAAMFAGLAVVCECWRRPARTS